MLAQFSAFSQIAARNVPARPVFSIQGIGATDAHIHAVTLRIEKGTDNATPTIRLIGRVRSQHLDALSTELRKAQMFAAIDLAEVTNLDVETVRFLSARELEGRTLANCSPFIREWIQREREMDASR